MMGLDVKKANMLIYYTCFFVSLFLFFLFFVLLFVVVVAAGSGTDKAITVFLELQHAVTQQTRGYISYIIIWCFPAFGIQ